MITVSVKQLVSTIEEADVFKLPEMNEGTRYVYNAIYRRLSGGMATKLSDIDFESFAIEDLDTMFSLHSKVLEPNENKADTITRVLNCVPPAAACAAFV